MNTNININTTLNQETNMNTNINHNIITTPNKEANMNTNINHNINTTPNKEANMNTNINHNINTTPNKEVGMISNTECNITIIKTKSQYNNLTKTLIIENNEHKVAPFRFGKYYNWKSFKFNNISELSSMLFRMENNINVAIVRDCIKPNIHADAAIRKIGDNFDQTPSKFLPIDIDSLNLSDINEKYTGVNFNDLDYKQISIEIIEKFLPELKDTSFHCQLSSTCFWKRTDIIKLHMYFLTDKPLSNNILKQYAKNVNRKFGFNLLDTSLYEKVRTLFTAKPRLGNGVDTDHIINNRSFFVEQKNNEIETSRMDLSKPDDIKPQRTVQKQQTKTKNTQNKSKSDNNKNDIYKNIKNVFLKDIYDYAINLKCNTHLFVLKITEWFAINETHLNINFSEFETEIIKKLKLSEKNKIDPNRIDLLIRTNELLNAYTGYVDKFKKNIIKKKSPNDGAIIVDEIFLKNIDDILDNDNDDKMIFLDSPPGTGKTELLSEYIQKYMAEHGQESKILSITHRVSLASDQSERFNLPDYNDLKNAKHFAINSNQMTVCINSLPHFYNKEYKANILILDEADLLLKHIFNKTIQTHWSRKLLTCLQELIKNADKVFIMQHNLSDITRQAFKMFKNENSKIIEIVNKYKILNKLPVNVFKYSKDLLTYSVKRLKELKVTNKKTNKHEMIFFMANSAKKAQKIEKFLSNKKFKCLLIISKTSENIDVKQMLQNPNNKDVIKGYDCVIASPKIESGFSINNEDFVETIGFAVASEHLGNGDSFVQQLFRCRKQKRISINVEDCGTYFEIDRNKIISGLIAKHQLIPTIINDSDSLQTNNVVYNEIPLHLRIELAFIVHDNKQRNTMGSYVYKELANMGAIIKTYGYKEEYEPEASKETDIEYKRVGKELEIEHRHEIINAKSITEDQYKIYTSKRDLSYEQYDEIERHELEQTFVCNIQNIHKKNSELAHNYLDIWDHGNGKICINNFDAALKRNITVSKNISDYTSDIWSISVDDSLRDLHIKHFVFKGVLESLHLIDLKYDPATNFSFTIDSLRNTRWFQFILNNYEAVRNANIGMLPNDKDQISDYHIISIINSLGLKIRKQTRSKFYKLVVEDTSLLISIMANRVKMYSEKWSKNTHIRETTGKHKGRIKLNVNNEQVKISEGIY